MKRFIALLLSCSLTLVVSAMAQNEPSPSPETGKAEKSEAGATGAAAEQQGHGGKKARAEAQASVQPTGQAGATGEMKTDAKAGTNTPPPMGAAGKVRGGKGKHNRANATGAAGETGANPSASAAVNGNSPANTGVGANARVRGGRGKNARNVPPAASATATAPAAASSTTATSPAATASVAGSSPAPSTAQTNTAPQSNTAARMQVVDPNSAEVQRLRKGKVQKIDRQTVQKVTTQHETFRAQPRPERVPTVTFNQNYRIEGADRWQGERYTVFRSYHPEFHDQVWYRSHYPRVEIIGGGAYYFNNNYWYPAWGYDNSAQYYAYDGPIYAGHRAVPPDRVIADVQAILQAQGYYQGEVDGLLGPLTRQALAAYQADAGLTPTAAIDEPTLDSLDLA